MVADQKHGRTLTREEVKKQKESARKERKRTRKPQKTEKKPTKSRRRIIPIWLRIVIIILLCFLALVFGLMIGYGMIGEGFPSDALNKGTWQHIVDIVFKE